jgi:hypothetical protein
MADGPRANNYPTLQTMGQSSFARTITGSYDNVPIATTSNSNNTTTNMEHTDVSVDSSPEDEITVLRSQISPGRSRSYVTNDSGLGDRTVAIDNRTNSTWSQRSPRSPLPENAVHRTRSDLGGFRPASTMQSDLAFADIQHGSESGSKVTLARTRSAGVGDLDPSRDTYKYGTRHIVDGGQFVENRYRPGAANQSPRPLNIDRNYDDDNDMRSSCGNYDNVTNVNLVSGHSTHSKTPGTGTTYVRLDGTTSPSALLIENNDPLVANKTVSRRNIYTQEEETIPRQIFESARHNIYTEEEGETIPRQIQTPRRNIYTEEEGTIPRRSTVVSVNNEIGVASSPTNSSAALTVQVCPVCSGLFPRLSMDAFQSHVFDCFDNENGGAGDDDGPTTLQAAMAPPAPPGCDEERTCPMCEAVFPGGVPQEQFEEHVQRHFSEDTVDQFVVLDPTR